MTGIDPNLWPAIEPSRGFADATVARMLAEPKHSPRVPRFWIRPFGLAMAAVFISGAALGWVTTQSRAKAPPAISAQPLQTSALVPIQPRVSRHQLPLAPELKLAPTPRTVTSAATMSSASEPDIEPNTPTPRPVLRVPACQCARGYSDTICDCY